MYCEKCGKYSGRYPLCKNCYYEENDEEDLLPFEEWEDVPGECLICGKDSGEYLFCRECYHKYKNKTITLQCKNCTDFQLIDHQYEGIYRCIDGHIVKSKAEREIDNYLFLHNIRHCYEKPIPVDNNTEIHPDFYLPDLDLYIEHWGKEDDYSYNETKKYKLDIYRKLRITLICTHEKEDSADIDSALNRKLHTFKRNQINFLDTTQIRSKKVQNADDDLPF